ncbi:MAG TPA: FAD/NAD(P)-binding protein [Chlamydiales bacterium]|nr:FAD/NAD(P)-binding protein [Chlamydiales bacterium]
MRFIFILFAFSLFAVDFDCVVVGTSPFSLFEALYQAHSGKRVLILEEGNECGGAWKSITICGISHADLGCHQIGHDKPLQAFLEEYAGCHLVSLDDPLISFTETTKSSNGYYFSQGCFELIDHLLQLIQKTDILLLLNHKLEHVWIDPSQTFATLKANDKQLTTSKIITTPMSCFSIDNVPSRFNKSKHYHLYMLIQDPTPPRFGYQAGTSSGVSRLMNLTHFVGLTNTGRQLLVFQTHSEISLTQGTTFLDDLKKRELLDPSAYILTSESYIYEQGHGSQQKHSAIFETINTGHFQSLSNYIAKWKQVLKPFKENL